MAADRAVEAAAAGAVGAALGGAAGSLVGLGIPVAVVAGLNGLVSGWRRVTPGASRRAWSRSCSIPRGRRPPPSPGSPPTPRGAARGAPGYSDALSRRQNRHVYERGLQLRRGFATTFGNVVCGAGDVSRARRAKLVTDHEDVHVWQARWFGPAYPALYLGWTAGAGAAGAGVWALRHRQQRLTRVVESCAYYMNPFEWWAYSRDDHWPPTGLIERFGWRRPVVRSFASVGGTRRRRRTG